MQLCKTSATLRALEFTKQILTSAHRGRPPSSSAMSTCNRLPRRLVWAALLFLFTGVCTASAEIEDFVRQVGSPPIGGATGALSAGAVVTVITSVALGVLYFWAGYGLLRRQERWRAVYLSRILIGFLGLGVLVFLFGEVSSIQIEGLRSTGQLTETLPLPRWTIRSLALLLLGAAMGAYWWDHSSCFSARRALTRRQADSLLGKMRITFSRRRTS